MSASPPKVPPQLVHNKSQQAAGRNLSYFFISGENGCYRGADGRTCTVQRLQRRSGDPGAESRRRERRDATSRRCSRRSGASLQINGQHKSGDSFPRFAGLNQQAAATYLIHCFCRGAHRNPRSEWFAWSKCLKATNRKLRR